MLHVMVRCPELDLDEDTDFLDNNTVVAGKKEFRVQIFFVGFVEEMEESFFR
jgi:hypothetical protein